MLADPDAVRALAAMLRARATEVRHEGDYLIASSVALDWRGRAGDAMRIAVADAVGEMRASATLHEQAADALHRHADAVESTLHVFADAAGFVGHVGHVVADFVGLDSLGLG